MLKNASWTAARDLLTEQVRPLGTEQVSLEECAGRVLAFDLKAAEDVPPFDRSAYDGYAFRAEDTAGASKDRPVTFRVTETVAAGSLASRRVGPGTAARLMTGAKIPEGADCVINFERTVFDRETVTLFAPLRPGDNVVKRGEDVAAGTLLAPRGTVIDAGLAGTLAAQGIVQIEVFRQPLIGLVSTGSEVVEAGEELTGGKIRNASRSSFTALLRREGCRVKYLGKTGDDAEDIAGQIAAGLAECDAVILTGGVSVGDRDVTPEAMELAGTDLLLRGVEMKPGMACAYGMAGGKPVLGLSGNPASALTNFCVCCLPALRKLCGKREILPRPIRAELRRGFRKGSPSDRFLRGWLALDSGTVGFVPAGGQGNAMLSATIGCEAFLLIPAGSGPAAEGTLLEGFLI